MLWFGMSIAAPHVLRAVHASTEVTAQIHSNDSRRRAAVFVAARESVVFNTVLFNTGHREFMVPSFAHFSVIVGPCGFESYRGDQLGLPLGSPHISPPLPTLDNLAVRSHRLSLEPHVDLDIIAMVLPGRVTVPVTFTSPERSAQSA